MKEQLRNLLKDMWNVPNVLTMLRLVLVPVFVSVYMDGHVHAALVIFCIASITDCLDGLIARKCHLVTSFGKLMDPLADKLMVCSALFCMSIRGIFPWEAVILVVVKELALIVGGTVLLKKGTVVYSNISGKLATCFFIAALICGFLHDDFLRLGWYPLDITLLWISVGLAVGALVNYTLASWKQLLPQKKK